MSEEKRPKLDTKSVILISGTSSGIGLGIAVHLANQGKHKVYATMRDVSKKEKLLEAAKNVGTNAVENLVVLEMDVTKEDTIAKAVQHILKADGKIDILICNAGFAMIGLVETTPVDEAKRIFDTNVFGSVRVMQHVVPYMRQQGSGKVIGMSSVSGLQAEPGLAYYCASKFALEAIFEAEAPLMKRFGINYVLVEPGMVQSDIVNNAKQYTAKKALLVDDKGLFKQFEDNYTALFEQNFMFADPVDDLVKFVQTIIETANPDLRYQFSSVSVDTAKAKLLDPTGNKSLEQNAVAINYILPQ